MKAISVPVRCLKQHVESEEGGGDVAHLGDGLPSKHKALSLTPNTAESGHSGAHL